MEFSLVFLTTSKVVRKLARDNTVETLLASFGRCSTLYPAVYFINAAYGCGCVEEELMAMPGTKSQLDRWVTFNAAAAATGDVGNVN